MMEYWAACLMLCFAWADFFARERGFVPSGSALVPFWHPSFFPPLPAGWADADVPRLKRPTTKNK